MKKGNEQCFCEGSRMLADKVSKLSKEVRLLREALDVAMGHIESTSCGKEPYRGNTIWRVNRALLAAKQDEGNG